MDYASSNVLEIVVCILQVTTFILPSFGSTSKQGSQKTKGLYLETTQMFNSS